MKLGFEWLWFSGVVTLWVYEIKRVRALAIFENIRLWGCEAVRLWGCEDIRLWGCECLWHREECGLSYDSIIVRNLDQAMTLLSFLFTDLVCYYAFKLLCFEVCWVLRLKGCSGYMIIGLQGNNLFNTPAYSQKYDLTAKPLGPLGLVTSWPGDLTALRLWGVEVYRCTVLEAMTPTGNGVWGYEIISHS